MEPTANVKISGKDDSQKLTFDLDMDLTIKGAQDVMVYVIEIKAKELAQAQKQATIKETV